MAAARTAGMLVPVAPALKDTFDGDVVRAIADQLRGAGADFASAQFIREAVDGLSDLELMERGRHVARVMHRHLPDDPVVAVRLLADSFGEQRWKGMASFHYLPHSFFIAEYGLPAFEESMRAQHSLTKVFTAEFSIRAFLVEYPDATLGRLRTWAHDDDEHVRRLVSEGTRPRLPWAARLTMFRTDPAPVIELLDLLVDDRSDYVRRSVANNLNDISRDNPDTALDTATRWLSPGRRPLIKHGLRTLLKAGNRRALALLGYSPAEVGAQLQVTPNPAVIGGKAKVVARLSAPAATPVLVDFRIHFVKAGGNTSSKVFRGVETTVGPPESIVRISVSLAQHSTRRQYPGRHRVDVLVNGRVCATTDFDVVA